MIGKQKGDSIRGSLRGLLDVQQTAQLIDETLRAGLEATKPLSRPCPSCGTSVKIEVADLGTRVTAAAKILEALEGKLREAASDQAEEETRRGKAVLKDIEEMSSAEIAEEIARIDAELSA